VSAVAEPGTLGPAFASSDRAREAACDALDRGETHYTTRPGLTELRQATADLLHDLSGISVAGAGGVLITCGEAEGLYVALRTLLGPGDQVLTVAPVTTSDLALLASLDAGVVAVPAGDPHDPQLDEAALAAASTENCRVLMLRTPGPTGVPLPAASLRLLAGLAQSRGLAVVTIETGQASYHAGHRPGLAAHLDPATPFVVIGEFGTPWGLEAWRVGYLAGSQDLVAPMTELKQALTICSPAVSQFAALAAITAPPAEAADRLGELARRAAAFAAACEEHGLRVIRPQAGAHILVSAADPVPDDAATIRRLGEAGITAEAGEVAGLPGWLRLSLNVPVASAAEVAARLVAVISSEEGR
jgi:aspartate/methionine/tyrosine aminotransferase